ncbi:MULTISPECIES: ABC transporter permease [unclassified Plantactinospora]|uniref:ABC transporter permease n=1 Tax=unclassified Plantactinospora TaxID=2631981 RepID=UPI000D17B0D6|nr:MULTISPECIES: ABC transporter permease [unclassified Plantactinospora]AVT28760.1 ABC transporter permease [Plantactinospora sp. BC1]AVT35161.1 ABC transporter permease [Plantactinospora sp. BB1]
MATIETQRDVTGEVVPGVVVPTRRPRWRGLLRSRKLAAGLAIVGFFALVAVLGPLLVDDPNQVSDDRLLAPSAEHLLGTTTTGQDVFRQLVAATRGSMLVGLVVGLLATVVSVLVGVLGGYAGGHTDESLSLVSNVFLVLPGLPLVVLITDYVQTRGALAIALIVSFTAWAGSARVLRAQTLSLRSRDYVDAARVSGEPGWRIVTFEILPNLLPLIAAQFVFAVIGGILTEAALAFLGLGGAGSWGTMLYFAQNSQALSQGAWWWFVPPGLCIALVGAGLALINFSLDELINPRLRVPRRPRRTGPA